MMAIAPILPVSAQPAVLRANSPNSVINLRSRPSTNGVIAYQGRSNDRVEILDEQIGDDGYIWYFVRLEASGAGGWVREDLIRSLNGQRPITAPANSNSVPNAARETCRNNAFARLNTFRGDVNITDARTTRDGTYEINWQQQSTGRTGFCTVNRRNEIIAVRDTTTTIPNTPGNSNTPTPSAVGETLHRFRTDDYVVRLYQQGEQVRINLREIASNTTVLNESLAEQVSADRAEIYLSNQDGFEYQVRVNPQRTYLFTIYEGDRRIYQQSGVAF
jgi:hypothetical protein